MEEIQRGMADNSHNGILLSTRPRCLIIQDGSRALTNRRLCDDHTLVPAEIRCRYGFSSRNTLFLP